MQTQTEAEFVSHGPCASCGSSDANALYSDGHTYCFRCETYQQGEDATSAKPTSERRKELIDGVFRDLSQRGLTEETCRKWGYRVGQYNGYTVHIAPYYSEITGAEVAQKLRFRNKDFTVLGSLKDAGLFGQRLWRTGGKRLVIVEGELDAMSVSQAQDHRWPVVSIPNGASGAAKALAKHLEWVNSYEKVVLCFDQDEAGREAVAKCVGLFPPGKVAVAVLPLKDANDMLVAGRQKELVTALWEAQDFRPDGIVKLEDVAEAAMEPPSKGASWFIPELDELLFGRRLGECVALGAGTGIGKTDFIMEQIAHDVVVLKQKAAIFALEQLPKETVQRVAGKVASKRFHVPDGSWTPAELRAAIDVLKTSAPLYLFDHFGAAEWDIIKERIRYLAHSEGVKFFYLDHLTALAAAEEDERVGLERIMSEMGSLVKELNIWILFVSHLATPEGKSHEEGGRVTIRQFKGSRAIGYWSVFMLGMERDQQAGDETERHTTTLRVLKDRLTGQATGQTVALAYDAATGRISAAQAAGADTGGF